jgi:hypothetical protein
MRQARDVYPCEESDRLVREVLGDRLAQIMAERRRRELEARREAIRAAGALAPPCGLGFLLAPNRKSKVGLRERGALRTLHPAHRSGIRRLRAHRIVSSGSIWWSCWSLPGHLACAWRGVP